MTRMSAVISCQFLVLSQGTKNGVVDPLEICGNAALFQFPPQRETAECYNRATMIRMMRRNVLITTLCIGVSVFLVGRAWAQDIKPETPPKDDLQSRVEDLADFFVPFIQEGNPGKVVFFDLVGPKGLRAPFGNWLADQISTSVARRYPTLQVIDRSTISSILEKRNREADHGSRAGDAKRDMAYAKQAGAEKCILGNFSSGSQQYFH